jgi:hypothetical protein
MIDIDAFHIPQLEDGDVLRADTRVIGNVRLHVPMLRPGVVTRVAARLRAARERNLVDRPVARIIESIDAATERLVSGESRDLLLAALPPVTGFSREMAARILDGMARDWRARPLHDLLRSELGEPDVLDRFVQRGDARVRALGVPLITHVFAGNVPGVAVTSLVRALLVKSASLGKTAAGEPLLAPHFARALAAVDPPLGECLAITYWQGGRSESEEEALVAADLIVVYGGEDAVAAVRRRASPHAHVVEHGPKLSIGLVGSAALHDDAAMRATAEVVATATADFDQHGCVSPHAVFVERTARHAARIFARHIADALDRIGEELPRGRIDTAAAARMRAAATDAEFRAIAGEPVTLFDGRHALVIYDDRPVFEASCLNRMLRVYGVDRLEDVPAIIAPYRDVLQSAAIAGVDASRYESLAARLAAAGITRITDFARLAWPRASWHHDGRGPLLELLRFIDLEADAPHFA